MRLLSPSLCCLMVASVWLSGCGSSNCAQDQALALSANVSTTSNTQVARYTFNAPSAGSVTVDFGLTGSYGFTTSPVVATAAGPVTVLVAGMLAGQLYHMRATFQSAEGEAVVDADQTFLTGGVPCKFTAAVTAETMSGQTPQPGIEMLDGTPAPVATDLQGNIIWTYPFQDEAVGVSAFPIRPLNDGNLLMLIGKSSSTVLSEPAGIDLSSELREVNLAGDTLKSLSITTLNAALAAAGNPLVLGGFSHDVIQLSNGHLITIATTGKEVTLTGDSAPTDVLGDAVIDLDTNFQPVWTWSAFDHLDPNRHPFNFPDWTHSNSLAYEPTDGSLILSMRHQNWILKLNYADGAGDGAIKWRLGPEGDFTLLTATGSADNTPEDWFYSQHYANDLGTDPNGVMTLALMDNGDDRQFANGQSCPVTAGSTCYTTIPVMKLDQNSMTASFLFHQILPPDKYSFFGGNNTILDNGNVEYDLAGTSDSTAEVHEVTFSAKPVDVWAMYVTGSTEYRAQRWPSLYPGVQWTTR